MESSFFSTIKKQTDDLGLGIFLRLIDKTPISERDLIIELSSFSIFERTLYVSLRNDSSFKNETRNGEQIYTIIPFDNLVGLREVIIDSTCVAKRDAEVIVNDLVASASENLQKMFLENFQAKASDNFDVRLVQISNLLREQLSCHRGQYTLTYFNKDKNSGYHVFDLDTIRDMLFEYRKIDRQHEKFSPLEMLKFLLFEELQYHDSLTKIVVESGSSKILMWDDARYKYRLPRFYIGARHFHGGDGYGIRKIHEVQSHVLSIGCRCDLLKEIEENIEPINSQMRKLFEDAVNNVKIQKESWFLSLFKRVNLFSLTINNGCQVSSHSVNVLKLD